MRAQICALVDVEAEPVERDDATEAHSDVFDLEQGHARFIPLIGAISLPARWPHPSHVARWWEVTGRLPARDPIDAEPQVSGGET